MNIWKAIMMILPFLLLIGTFIYSLIMHDKEKAIYVFIIAPITLLILMGVLWMFKEGLYFIMVKYC